MASSEEKNQLLSTFKLIDKNGDGKISEAELIEGISPLLTNFQHTRKQSAAIKQNWRQQQ